MLKRETYIKSISDKLAILEKSIENRSSIQLLDVNVIAEQFVAELINLKNDWNLRNLNSNYTNFPAVDLGDLSNRVAVQVTSTKTCEKINHTLEFATKHNLTLQFDSIIIFIITKKQKNYSKLKIPENITFNWRTNIWDWNDIIKDLNHLSINRLQNIADFIDREIDNHTDKTKFTDEATIKIYRQFFNSGMMKDDFNVEADVTKFYDTLQKHIELINTGKRDKKIQCKAYYEINNPSWKKTFDVTHERLLSIRSLYISCVKNGDINLKANFKYYNGSNKIAEMFNILRKQIIEDLNIIFKSVGESEIKLNY